MVKEAKTETARKGSRVIIGPWNHGICNRRYGNIDFGPDAVLDKVGVQIRWFDFWLKDIQNGVDKDAQVKIFVMGDNKWRDEQYWPLHRTEEKTFFIMSKGQANTPSGNGKLVDERPQSIGIDNYVYDPRDPVPTSYGQERPRVADRRPLANRQDILVYQTELLTERIEVTGNPIVELYAASSAPDTAWFVWLIDVAPDGLARDVSSGMLRARYRDGTDKPKLIKPHEVVKYNIRMKPTSNAFLPGHHIRLDITSSDFPSYDRNHNTPFNQNADATLVTASQTIYHGGEQATRIILPWVPNPPEEEKYEPEPEKQMYQFHQAAADGDIERVKQLISEGADVNAKDEGDNTPLCHAVRKGMMEMVQLLVKAGADVNAGSWPPLCEAVDKNDIVIAKYLIGHGANVNSPEDWTPLQEAPYIDNNIEMIELLIAKGANINAGEWTALHGAVKEGRRDIVELLIQKGADVNAKGKGGYTPLYYSIQKEDLDMAKLLITKSADINSKDNDGRTPLHYALSTNKKGVAELLLAKNMDFKSKDKNGLTALHYAAVNEYQDIANMLLTKGVKVDERDDVYEFTALHYAARFGHKNVAEVLITNGADIIAKDKWDYQPIHWAAYHDRADLVELLIAKGADVNAKTSLGQTPIQLAQERRNTKTVELLRKHGAKE
jgi:ankyrin repeat protein